MDYLDAERVVAAHNRRVFAEYERHQRHFTERQWLVVCLRYQHGLTNTRIAELLGRVESTISSLLGRAKDVLDAQEKRLRSESYEVRRNLLDE